MAYSHPDFELALSSVAGDDMSLRLELRESFLESLANQIDLLRRSRCDGNWRLAAERIKGLGASFHAARLVALAEEALDGAPGDPAILRKLSQFTQDFSVES
ncbi:Hpt domain-containing protein [Aurantiacibacter sediminis]|uniref:Hpt domain-containing protein n=1 Tax=Aurantiacibacter sediminis TaxID=2793064 RepID=A0ABS0N411_9SPHN|nr:Hpt domain-containing protein [Aurantiacibacter sediminis]MBH5322715.1 Hpt domain-containing protein [Aurantiacibacter sediminis]